MAFVVLAAGTAGYLYLEHLNDNIQSVSDDGAGTGGFSKDKAINILLIGTDKRTGSGNDGYGDAGSEGTPTPRSCCMSPRTAPTRPR
ncbi:hypothetical protein SHKM778_85130 [Streptomyces sp. KM77-8]|uniref:LytR family transcriptional regulator n=1 Tax=Streptomyces haneummycinicus TaxID=3074435 RepID=A0AAT9HXL2_9ACTN